ncbi:MAG: hypothetical protein FWB73_04215 [Treponema sp.]|nr:hypothetical protein [Treponema sp.]
MYKYFCLLFLFFPLLFSGCLGVTEGVGRFFDGSVFTEKTVARYALKIKKGDNIDMEISVMQNKAKEKSIIISFKKYPMIKFRASMPAENGEFHLTSLEYLSGSTHGWNEYTMQMMGTGSLILSDNATLDVIKDMEKIQISKGRIHRYDTRIIGNDALSALRNRNERIDALSSWMLSLDHPKGQDIKAFQKLWKPLFFPEMVSEKKRSENWRQKEDVFQIADDIRWNTGYTERVFPEQLRPIRDTGTLLRDWEEALYWIYLEYEWDSIKALFSQKIILNKTK